MRTIKFRVWYESKMIYDVYPGRCMSCSQIEPAEPGSFDLDEESPTMQFTGCLDRNVREIYEGDIVGFLKFSFELIVLEVRWSPDGCWIPFVGDMDGINEIDPWKCEVIGNIYENPELLK